MVGAPYTEPNLSLSWNVETIEQTSILYLGFFIILYYK